MHPIRRKKFIKIIFTILCLSSAIALILSALKQNINFYLTPTDVFAKHFPPHIVFRLGGVVQANTIQFSKHPAQVNFMVSDFHHQISVSYDGVLPALFHEGRGVVVEGYLDSPAHLHASQVLAKHDNNYMPPKITNIGK